MAAPVKSRLAVVLLDLLLLGGLMAALVIILTGGWEWRTPFGLVRAHTASNLLYFVAVLALARFALAGSLPVFFRILDVFRLPLPRLTRLAAGVIVASTLAKLANVYFHYGFCCGDDLEIHEMTFGPLLGVVSPVWNLRTPIYPMGVIYPIQAAAVRLGITDPRALVSVARLAVAAMSLVAIWLTYRLARRLSGDERIALTAAIVLAFSKTFSALASSELPGVLCAVLLLAGNLLLLGPGVPRLLAASALIGTAASFRFGELLFVAPGVLTLLARREYARGFLLGLLSAAWFLALVGLADILYWGRAFASLSNIVEFTLVRGMSSRGFQPFHYYLSSAWNWADWLLLGAVAYGVRRTPFTVSAWFLVPLLLLSLLPHKEARYLVPAMPFVSILAANGFWRLYESESRHGWIGSRAAWRTLIAGAFVFAMLLEADGVRFRRSEAVIDAVSGLDRLPHVQVVALEQSWRAGGRLFLRSRPTVLNLDGDTLRDDESLRRVIEARRVDVVGLLQSNTTAHQPDHLLSQLGFREVDSIPQPGAYRLFARPTALER